MNEKIKLTTHVGRDLIASASSFKKEDAVIWEYVVNSLQYIDQGTTPNVQITINLRKPLNIRILDNGRGMDVEGLKRFFQMHGENIDRMRGRPGRGKFGTGKSAAFGIAGRLYIETIRDGFKNSVELTRDMITSTKGESIPIKWLEKDVSVDSKNGTLVEISDIYLPKISVKHVSDYIERHIGAFQRNNALVAVNNHICEYREPEYAKREIFSPSGRQVEILGQTELCIKVSRRPLEKNLRGIAITAGYGNTVAIEDGGLSEKEFGNYLFGEIDCPAIELYESNVEPYDVTRSLQLNPNHPVAGELLRFIGSRLDSVRRDLVKESKEEQKSEQARRLTEEASKIADIINDDYKNYKDRLNMIRSATSKPGHLNALFGEGASAGDEDELYVKGLLERGILESNAKPGTENKEAVISGRKDPDIRVAGLPDKEGTDVVEPAGGESKRKTRPKGGFNVDYKNLGIDEHRSRYDDTALTILINLDHPVIKTALDKKGPEDISFKRLAYEIAFTEYSLAVGYELINQDPDMPADDLMYEVRSTLNRISRNAAGLYRI
jgi:hypothetical protein